jgi:endonuclease III
MQSTELTCSKPPVAISAEETIRRLRDAYGRLEPRPHPEPIDELIATILSQNTSDSNTARAFSNLRARFPTWDQVVAASDSDVTDAIRSGGLADTKAPRIRRVLADVRDRVGSFDLGFLSEQTVEEARAWLTSLPGVGPKTASCVLLFCFNMPAMPVDTHVHRVALRLRLIPERTSAERACGLLEDQVSPAEMYDAHMLMIQHGRRTCHARRPACAICVLRDRCPTAAHGGPDDRNYH